MCCCSMAHFSDAMPSTRSLCCCTESRSALMCSCALSACFTSKLCRRNSTAFSSRDTSTMNSSTALRRPSSMASQRPNHKQRNGRGGGGIKRACVRACVRACFLLELLGKRKKGRKASTALRACDVLCTAIVDNLRCHRQKSTNTPQSAQPLFTHHPNALGWLLVGCLLAVCWLLVWLLVH